MFIIGLLILIQITNTENSYCSCDNGLENGIYCFKTIQNCLDCSNYIVNEQDICTSVTTCDQTTQQQKDCKTCIDNYLLSNGQCWQKILYCSLQIDATCQKCQDKYLLKNQDDKTQICINSNEILNCKYYLQNGKCNKCDNNYHVSINSTICYQDIKYCDIHLDDKCTSCITGYSKHTNSTFCFPDILNCQITQTFYIDETQKTYCNKCNDGYQSTENKQCSLDDKNCLLFNQDLTICLKCLNDYILIGKKCEFCPIKFCSTCGDSQIFKKICSQCQSGYVKGSNALSCIGQCESQTSTMTNCVSCSNSTCSKCSDGYFINPQGKCTACSAKYASCEQCIINKCTSCSNNYYYDNSKQYCFLCSTFNTGCQTCLNTMQIGTTNNIICQKCESGYVLTSTQQCTKCGQLFENCDTCINLGNNFQCNTCLPGYLKLTDTSESTINPTYYCLDCSGSIINLLNCYKCEVQSDTSITNQYICKLCKDGYYLEEQSCLKCPNTCTQCTSLTTCTKCQTSLILNNGQCTDDTTSFQLTSSANSNDALAYGNILISKSSLGPFPFIGTLNSKGFFCQSDKQCNMYGKCLLISCKCIQNISGSRCQFTTTSDFIKLQTELLTYLNTQTIYDPIFVDIIQLISDTTYAVTESNIKSFQQALEKLIALKFDLKYFTTIGAISKNLFNQENIASQKLNNLDNSLFNSILKQSESIMISEIQNTQGPFHKQIIGKFDLFSDDSYSTFKYNFVKSYGTCDNDKKLLTPQIYFTEENLAEIKILQSDAQTPLIFNQMHLYYQNHRSSGQTINSTISRIQLIKSGKILPVSGMNMVIVVPKNDQYYADLNENNVCVQWNEDKQIWENTKATLLKCKYYTVCQVNNLGDFGTYVQLVRNVTNNSSGLSSIFEIPQEFKFVKTVQNSAFAISMTLIGLFLTFLTLLCILYKRPIKKKKQKKYSDIYETVQTGNVLVQNPLNQVKTRKKSKNFWSVYPINAIFTASSLEFSLQKLSLYIIQIQMYVTFTSVYLSSLPFKFGMLTAYYLLVIIQTWICNYLYGGLALAFRKKRKGTVFGFYWILWVILFLGNMIIGIWQMYGLEFKFDMYLLVGVLIEFILDSIFCDLFLTYLYQSLFINEVVGIFKIIKFKGYYEQ
ncbi:unnamed protein product [Paramecium pentaurelia]|uniref:EGF-like domain-containing protein n=1 Tax=Paramecium pentaurelia TaxID=43138 RepID=A0A8S1WMN2_9CILI|nr:unnamed protein product [Paramecium pentaurelia]